MKKILLLFFIIGLVSSVIAQHTCITSDVYNKQLKIDSSILQNQYLFNVQARLQEKATIKKSGAVSIIPVVFHIIHNTGSGNISDAQIEDALRILNEDFRRLNPSAASTRDIFKGVAADMEIEFRLARKDPNGNCTNGIVRVFSEETSNGSDSLKKISHWPNDKYLNIWVVENITMPTEGLGVKGYTQYPWTNKPETDGIVLMHRGIGTIGTSNTNNAHNITHEAGHWLGCLHTFHDGCLDGDSVADTPPCEKRTSVINCDTTRNTCNTGTTDLPDQIENYMDFTVGSCQNMFTLGQKARMDATLLNWRPLISSIQNLIATGTDKVNAAANCTPIARFVTVNSQLEEVKTVCTNASISFKDLSYNYSGAISYQWIFESGTPATSNQQNPSVTYNQIGSFDVILIVSNTKGVDSIKLKDYITVNPTTAINFAPFVQDFEDLDFATSNWTTSGNSTQTFSITNVGAGTVIPNNSKTLFLENNRELSGTVINLNSPAFNLSSVAAPLLSFFYAAALRPFGTNSYTSDGLKIFYSIDCGQSWSQIWSRRGLAFSTLPTSTPGSNQPFFPSEDSKWKQVIIPVNPTIPSSQQSNVRFRFQFTSAGGNNFFMDGINIGFPASIQKNVNNKIDFTIYPNPSNKNTTVSFTTEEISNVTITVIDALGRELTTLINNKELAPKNHKLPLTITKNGVYFIKLKVNNSVYYKKLILN